jgi:hypothetical protein
MEKIPPPRKKQIEQAKELLENQCEAIYSVAIWAEMTGFDIRKTFWRNYRAVEKESPYEAFTRKRKKRLIEYVQKNPECRSSDAAQRIHLSDGNALYQFCMTHFNISFTELKARIHDGHRPDVE